MKKNNCIKLAAMVLCLLLFVGCGEKAELGPVVTNTVFIEMDGSIIDYEIDTLDQDYYSVSDLDSMVRDDASTYNKEVPRPVNGSSKPLIAVNEVAQLENGNVRVGVEFQTVEAMVTYNERFQVERKAFYGTVSEAIARGYEVKGNLYSRKRGNMNALTDEQIDGIMSKNIFIITEPVNVRFEGEVLYFSNNVVMNADATEATVPEGETGYFLFK